MNANPRLHRVVCFGARTPGLGPPPGVRSDGVRYGTQMRSGPSDRRARAIPYDGGITWPEVHDFDTLRALRVAACLRGEEPKKVTYRNKIKLHGTLGAVVFEENDVQARSRNRVLTATPGGDNAGFGAWVASLEKSWKKNAFHRACAVFGEWCGPGVQPGVALDALAQCCFVVFGAVAHDRKTLFIEPEELKSMVPDSPNVHVLPWHGPPWELDWSASESALDAARAQIAAEVNEIYRCDPWVKRTFGVEGAGEGLVGYPLSQLGYEWFSLLGFKAEHDLPAERPKRVKREEVSAMLALPLEPDVFVATFLTEELLQEVRSERGIENEGRFVGTVVGRVTALYQRNFMNQGGNWTEVRTALIARAQTWMRALNSESDPSNR